MGTDRGRAHAAGSADGPTALGVYGLRLAGLPGAAPLLAPADPAWPVLAVHQRVVAELPAAPDAVSGTSGSFQFRGRAGAVHLTREPLAAGISTLRRWPDEAIVHPFLAMAAAVVTWWHGRCALHAGAFAGPGGAWVVAGAKESGKSTLLAQLARRGVPVLCDDLAVVEGDRVLAGPGCIDLRADAGERIGGEDLGVVGSRRRFRLRLPERPASAPLRGFVLPVWGSSVRVTEVTGAARLERLVRHLALTAEPRGPGRLLELAALPMYEVSRPRDWDAADRVSAALLDL